jgi:hypothetical protein
MPSDASGTTAEWEKVSSIGISTHGIALVDPMSWVGPTVDLAPGTYDIMLQMLANKRKVSRVRVVRAGGGGSAARVIDQVSTDFPVLGILDASGPNSGLGTGSGYEIQVVDAWQRGEPWGIVKWGDEEKGEMVYVKTGFEDGRFDVKEVLKAGRRIGFEIEFTHRGKRTPINDVNI